jgi:hypothetical protein
MMPRGRGGSRADRCLEALEPADELAAACAQASDDGIDVRDAECEVAEGRRVRRAVRVAGAPRRAWNFTNSIRPSPSGVSIIA